MIAYLWSKLTILCSPMLLNPKISWESKNNNNNNNNFNLTAMYIYSVMVLTSESWLTAHNWQKWKKYIPNMSLP